VSRTFSRAGYTAHSATPRGQQEPINFGPGASNVESQKDEGRGPKAGRRGGSSDGGDCVACLDGCNCCCACGDCCECCDAGCCDC
jgi:hypothetical protein